MTSKTTEDALRAAAEELQKRHPRPCSDGVFIDVLLCLAADELHQLKVSTLHRVEQRERETANRMGCRPGFGEMGG